MLYARAHTGLNSGGAKQTFVKSRTVTFSDSKLLLSPRPRKEKRLRCLIRYHTPVIKLPSGELPSRVSRQRGECEHQAMRLRKHLDDISPKQPFQSCVCPLLRRKPARKIATGGGRDVFRDTRCDTAIVEYDAHLSGQVVAKRTPAEAERRWPFPSFLNSPSQPQLQLV